MKTARVDRFNALRRACGLPEVPREGRWRDIKEPLFLETVRVRDEIWANCAAYCRQQLGYSRVTQLDGVSNGTVALVLVQCGWGPNPDCSFGITYCMKTKRVLDDSMETHEYWQRKADMKL